MIVWKSKCNLQIKYIAPSKLICLTLNICDTLFKHICEKISNLTLKKTAFTCGVIQGITSVNKEEKLFCLESS